MKTTSNHYGGRLVSVLQVSAAKNYRVTVTPELT